MTEVIKEGSSSESLPEEVARATLDESEIFWRDNSAWLEEHGYRLRARYQPGWKASWLGSKKEWRDCEDAHVGLWTFLMDATRINDASPVIVKKITVSEYREEAELARTLSSEPYTSDPKNHCVPIYDVLEPPGTHDIKLLVMPLLYSSNEPSFDTLGEVIDYIRQIIEGLQFLHQHNIAHRDYKFNNTMAASSRLYSQPPHPCAIGRNYDFTGRPEVGSSRTQTPIKYYVIDFGLSKRYKSKEGNLEAPPWGGYSEHVPEFKTPKPCDPFPVDVFYLGHLLRRHFVVGTPRDGGMRGIKFLERLTEDMTQADPKKRPTIDEVRKRFDILVKKLSWRHLRSPAFYPKRDRWTLGQSLSHWKTQIGCMYRGLPAIPQPSPSTKA